MVLPLGALFNRVTALFVTSAVNEAEGKASISSSGDILHSVIYNDVWTYNRVGAFYGNSYGLKVRFGNANTQ